MQSIKIISSKNELMRINAAIESFETFLEEELEDDDLTEIFSTIGAVLSANKLPSDYLLTGVNLYGKRSYVVTERQLDMFHKMVIIMKYIGGGDDDGLLSEINGAYKSFAKIVNRNNLDLSEPQINYGGDDNE